MPNTATEQVHDASRAPEYGATPGTADTPNEARQAVTGHGARYVLIFSLGGVILAFALIYALFLS
jgi:hypothetical protein